ncbi:MAG: glycosyltransferase family 2 protein [Candidatus Aminicenantes bacterium]|nr:glycosyltransferase family 2 protein [Candidatus Aminicenantes bacterium]
MQRTVEKQGLLVLPHKNFFTWDLWEPVAKLVILVVAVVIIGLALKENLLFNIDNYMGRDMHLFYRYLLMTSSSIFVFSMVFRTYLWFKYRPYDVAKVADWPRVTIAVPAYNEGAVLYETVASIVRCDYPRDKLEIITVDDGSMDNTYFFMEKARQDFPDLVKVIKLPKNSGKRVALHAAFKKATAPFFVTVDSDTSLESHAIKEILTPLLLNEKSGAVTGRVKIWNSSANILTRMLNAYFAMAFDYGRAVQSTFSSVMCTSGAFSAYRVSVLSPVIDQWLKQRFLNRHCTYGEDRSLANHVLRSGAGTIYQRSAVAFTIVPETLKLVFKMLTRWARSNIRESIVFSGFMFNIKRKGNRLLPFIEFMVTVSLMFLHFVWFYYFFFSRMLDMNFILRLLAFSMLFGFVYMLYYLRIDGKRDLPYILVFSLFCSVFMIWIFTVAGLTLTKKSWSTR